MRAKRALRYAPVRLTGAQAKSVGMGFAEAVGEAGCVVLACAILPEHVHTVIARSNRPIERIIGHLKGRATQRLRADGLDPLAGKTRGDGSLPSPWGRRAWHVYLNDSDAVGRAVRYVRDNPLKEGYPRQHWTFVTPPAEM